MNPNRSSRTIFLGLFALACSGPYSEAKVPVGESTPVAVAGKSVAEMPMGPQPSESKPKVTFVELGSVNCVPCKAMKLVTDKLEKKYPKDLRIVFHDVWTEQGEKAAAPYSIRSIPTQVFLDEKGKEFFRHEGYFSQDEIEKLLKGKRVLQ